MKNILKKFLLLVAIGILGQSYIENMCWGMEKKSKIGETKKPKPPKNKVKKNDESKKEKKPEEVKEAETQGQAKIDNFFTVKKKNIEEKCNLEKIKTFNPDGFWDKEKYVPMEKYIPKTKIKKDGINHSSRGAIVFMKDGTSIFERIFDENFIAKGSNTNLSIFPPEYQKCILCKHNNSSPTTPRVHSEIAFLQYLTGNDNPKNISSVKFLKDIDKENKYKESDQIIILIKNLYLMPCSSGDDKGITCMKYIDDFCKKLKELTYKKIICIIQYDTEYPNFAKEEKEIEGTKDENGKPIKKIKTKDGTDIIKFENFYGRKAIVYCY